MYETWLGLRSCVLSHCLPRASRGDRTKLRKPNYKFIHHPSWHKHFVVGWLAIHPNWELVGVLLFLVFLCPQVPSEMLNSLK
jgi:hypothetical protein